MSSKASRRDFLKRMVATGAGAYTLGRWRGLAEAAPPSADKGRSKVVIVRKPGLGPWDGRPRPDQQLVEDMLARGLRELTGEDSPIKAWKRVFQPTDLVGLKVNCIGKARASTRPEVAHAIAAGVQLTGVAPDNITIWDRRDSELPNAGFAINRDGPGVKCYGTEKDYGEEIEHRSFRGCLSRVLTERSTAFINVPILKDHNNAGVTAALKNHYGTCNNPGAHHGNHCDPYLADLNDVPAIRDHTRLIVCDAIQVICEGGPGFRSPDYLWDYGGIMLSFDPVAIDFVGWQMIDRRRREIGVPTVAEAGREPTWIASAEALGLGAARADKIDLVEIQV